MSEHPVPIMDGFFASAGMEMALSFEAKWQASGKHKHMLCSVHEARFPLISMTETLYKDKTSHSSQSTWECQSRLFHFVATSFIDNIPFKEQQYKEVFRYLEVQLLL